MDIHPLRLDGCEALVCARGAELQALRLGGHDLLWDGGPLWPKHAPLLFPIVGSLAGNTYHHDGRAYTLPRHGFARDRTFTWQARTDTQCSLELTEDATTLAAYPFPFRLQVHYRLSADGLDMAVMLTNPGAQPLPASLGLHPAFRWPLREGLDKGAHRLTFDQDEPGPVHRLNADGLLDPNPHSSPIHAGRLPLTEGLFAQDALVFLAPRSRGLRYGAAGGPALRLTWQGFPQLGLWAKTDPGPAFLCIEPWAGHADPTDWQGAFQDKPGSFQVAPGETHHGHLTVRLEPDS